MSARIRLAAVYLAAAIACAALQSVSGAWHPFAAGAAFALAFSVGRWSVR